MNKAMTNVGFHSTRVTWSLGESWNGAVILVDTTDNVGLTGF